MSAIVLGVGTHPLRVDLSVHAGDPIDYAIPVRDSAGVLLDLTSWSASAVVSTPTNQPLANLTIVHDVTGLTIFATGQETAQWAETWPTYSPWCIHAEHPDGEPLFRAAGWVSLYR